MPSLSSTGPKIKSWFWKMVLEEEYELILGSRSLFSASFGVTRDWCHDTAVCWKVRGNARKCMKTDAQQKWDNNGRPPKKIENKNRGVDYSSDKKSI